MNSTDKTRQQLMDSMRKTKASAAAKKASVKKRTSQPATRKAQPMRASNAAATGAGKQSANAAGVSRSVNPDAYQAGRRVWPD